MNTEERAPRITRVVAALRDFGGRNDGTQLPTASTPVRAAHPEEKARSTRNAPPSAVRPWSKAASGTISSPALGAAPICPVRACKPPASSSSPSDPMNRYTGTARARPDSRTPRRFTRVTSTIRPIAIQGSQPCRKGRPPEA